MRRKRYRRHPVYGKNYGGKKQKGGAIGAGLALGMLAPMLMGTLGNMMKVNING